MIPFKHYIYSFLLIFLILPTRISAQEEEKNNNNQLSIINYDTPQEFIIAEVTISGNTQFDHQSIIMLSGLSIGQRITIPGERIASAMDNFWKQNLFKNIIVTATKIINNQIYLDIYVEDQPKISNVKFIGIKKLDISNVKEQLDIKDGATINENLISSIKPKSEKYFREKGFLNTSVSVEKNTDSITNEPVLIVNVQKGHRVKISKINISGNEYKKDNDDEKLSFFKRTWQHITDPSDLKFSDKKIKRKLKKTKEIKYYRFWKRSKFYEEDFKETDITNLIKAYNQNGFRDAKVKHYEVVPVNNKRVNLNIDLEEGAPYYFGDVQIIGNTKYTSDMLLKILDIKKGDVYDEEKLNRNLQFNPQSGDIFSLYYDDGYLTFQAIPVEIKVENDSIFLEIRIREGKQATFDRVEVKGNTRTNDHVIVRELRTYPGVLFSRSDMINSLNELRMLRYFNDQTINFDVVPNLENGSVADIAYTVEEVGSDQLELSGGWGNNRILGTIGLSFNNFSIQNMFKKDRWTPLPSGDGQRLTLRAQSSGSDYWSVSGSFTEPWLGGRKPLALSLSGYFSQQSSGLYSRSDSRFGGLMVKGVSLGLGQRLRWPDNYFTLYQSLSFQQNTLKNYTYSPLLSSNGNYNDFSYTITLGRQSLDAANFPTSGSDFSISCVFTPPYSLLNNKDYSAMDDYQRYEWLEYTKFSIKAGIYMNPVNKLVLNARFRFGVMGIYNTEDGALSYPPFQRYYLGGDGLSGYDLTNREIIGLRGYANNCLSSSEGSIAFSKMTFELRYPLTLNPAAMIYALAFVEAGNAWDKDAQINPFDMYKSAGVGVRLAMAAIGMFGLDWGYGFDRVPGDTSPNKSQKSGSRFHFSINQSLDW